MDTQVDNINNSSFYVDNQAAAPSYRNQLPPSSQQWLENSSSRQNNLYGKHMSTNDEQTLPTETGPMRDNFLKESQMQ
jgi:hypothetical protein